MKLDTVARTHAEEIHGAIRRVPIPPLELVIHPRRRSRHLLAAVAAGAVAVAAVVAAVLLTPGAETVSPTTAAAVSDRSTTTTTAVVEQTMEELRTAVAESVEVLRNADGLEGLQMSSMRGYLANVTWFSTRADGSEAALQWADLDITAGIWTDGVPLASGERLEKTVTVLIDGTRYIAQDSDPADNDWGILRREVAGTTVLALSLLGREDPFGLDAVADDASVTTRELIGGGMAWTLVTPLDGSEVVQLFEIRPDGSLAWSAQTADPAVALDPTTSFTAVSVDYRVLVDPEQIPRPALIPPSAYPTALGVPSNLVSRWPDIDRIDADS